MSDWLAGLQAELGDRVRVDAETLDAHRHDAWALAELWELLCAVVEPDHGVLLRCDGVERGETGGAAGPLQDVGLTYFSSSR